MEKTTTKPPRGYRNNNPLNIRRSKAKWLGLKAPSSSPEGGENKQGYDKAFCQFVAMQYGWRAAFRLLYNYWHKHGCDTIRKIISRWAPPADNNNTEAYIKHVVKHVGWQADEELPPIELKPYTWCTLALAMADMENGTTVGLDVNTIMVGWAMAIYGK